MDAAACKEKSKVRSERRKAARAIARVMAQVAPPQPAPLKKTCLAAKAARRAARAAREHLIPTHKKSVVWVKPTKFQERLLTLFKARSQ